MMLTCDVVARLSKVMWRDVNEIVGVCENCQEKKRSTRSDHLSSDLELSNWTATDEGGTHSREMADIFPQRPRW